MLKAALFLCGMLISRAECYYTQHIIWIMRGCVGFTISPLMFILQFAQRPCKKENNILQHCIAQKSITANACRGWIRCSKHPFHAALQSDVGKPERWEPQETFNKSTIYHLNFGLKSVSCVYISKVVFFIAI